MHSSLSKHNAADDCQLQIVQADVKIKPSAAVFFTLDLRRPDLYPVVYPTVYKSVKTLEGRAGKLGSVIRIDYTVSYKKNYAAFDVIDGYLTTIYKRFRVILSCFPKCDGSIVRWTLEYEKKNQDGPDPTEELTVLIKFTRLAEKYLLTKNHM
ncbi:hypothetical protein ACFE04_029436 [Oxalis oulophora]